MKRILLLPVIAALLHSCAPYSNANKDSENEKMQVHIVEKKQVQGPQKGFLPSFVWKWVAKAIVDGTIGKLTENSKATSMAKNEYDFAIGKNKQYVLIYRTFEAKGDKPERVQSAKLALENLLQKKDPKLTIDKFTKELKSLDYISFAALLEFKEHNQGVHRSTVLELDSYIYPVLKAGALKEVFGKVSFGLAKSYDEKEQALVITITSPSGAKPPVKMIYSVDWQHGSTKVVRLSGSDEESRKKRYPKSGPHAFVPWEGKKTEFRAEIIETAEISELLDKAEEEGQDWLVDELEDL